MKRVFLVVIDSFGIGEMPDAYKWNDEGSSTLGAIRDLPEFDCPNLTRLGLFNIEGIEGGIDNPVGCCARLAEASNGKDTTTGHWEMAGIVSENPMPTFPNGFPPELIEEFERRTGRKVLCNLPYSGTEVIKDYGEQAIAEGALIVYTSADSVFQIAAHEDYIPVEQLYEYCRIAREMLTGEFAVGRVIARPFTGEYPYVRTPRRHDFSLVPPKDTMLDNIKAAGMSCIPVGKIYDIFAGKGLTESNPTVSNADGMEKTLAIADRDFEGICFTNLVETDSNYGHRNDAAGYARAVSEIDAWLSKLEEKLRDDDILIVTADHGCDPSTASTDHSREYVPMLAFGKNLKKNVNLGTFTNFAVIGATICEYLGVKNDNIFGNSFLSSIEERC